MDGHVQDGWMLLGTVTIGSLLMYLFNALTGQYRRAWLRGSLTKMLYRTRHALDATCRNVRKQVGRLLTEARTFAEKIAREQ